MYFYLVRQNNVVSLISILFSFAHEKYTFYFKYNLYSFPFFTFVILIYFVNLLVNLLTKKFKIVSMDEKQDTVSCT